MSGLEHGLQLAGGAFRPPRAPSWGIGVSFPRLAWTFDNRAVVRRAALVRWGYACALVSAAGFGGL